jgi:hypothetical protein
MKNMLRFIKLLLIAYGFGSPFNSMAQSSNSQRTVLSLGIHWNYTPKIQMPFSVEFGFGTTSMERMIRSRVSVIGSFGINPTGQSWDEFLGIRRFNWNASVEIRKYFAFQSDFPMTGLFAGGYLGFDHLGNYYRSTGHISERWHWMPLGISFGYQHAFYERMRVSLGIVPAFPRRIVSEAYSPNGDGPYRITSARYLTLIAFVRIGIAIGK